MSNRIIAIKNSLKNNKKIVENYFFMTALQLLNSFFYLLVYPYLIRVLGAENYGSYVFATSIATYFIVFISFGFDFPAVKLISQNQNDIKIKSEVVSSVMTAKLYLLVISFLVFIGGIFLIHPAKDLTLLLVICFGQTIVNIIFPIWYFQGIQKMKFVTIVQLLFKLLSLPFIFLLIKSIFDNWIFALIILFTNIFGGITIHFILKYKEGIKFKIVELKKLKNFYRDSLPFFWSSSAGIVKQQSITVILGSFFSMSDVAIYDLANKIILLPQTLTMSINGALFPKVINNLKIVVVKKIFKYEIIVGLLCILLIALFGKYAVLILAGEQMLASYPMAIVLSVTVLTWLVVGCYISFIFVPQNKYYYVTKNQIVAFITFFLFCGVGILLVKNIFAVAMAISLSGLCEIVYCYWITKHRKLFSVL